MQIMTRKEAKASGLDKYFTGKPCSRGHICERRASGGQCIECQRLVAKEHYQNNIEAYKLRAREWEQANPDRCRELKQSWLDENRDKHQISVDNWNARNIDKRRATIRLWSVNNREKCRSKGARYRANKFQAQPSWVDTKILTKIYADCPEGFHVDHKVPLKHPLVCGLHVPWNLEPIPARDNLIKHNKFDPETYVHVFPHAEDYELPLAA